MYHFNCTKLTWVKWTMLEWVPGIKLMAWLPAYFTGWKRANHLQLKMLKLQRHGDWLIRKPTSLFHSFKCTLLLPKCLVFNNLLWDKGRISHYIKSHDRAYLMYPILTYTCTVIAWNLCVMSVVFFAVKWHVREKLVPAVQNHIKSLNWGHRVKLHNK